MAVAAALAIAVSLPAAALSPETSEGDKDKKPVMTLKASPAMGFAPLRVFLSAELKGGPNDFEELYCPTVEWDWGDGTRSESTLDCDPYEAGRSEIKRRFAVEHVFRLGGRFNVHLRLKRKNKVVLAASTTMRIQSSIPGLSQ